MSGFEIILAWAVAIGATLAAAWSLFELLIARAERRRDAEIIRWQRPNGPLLPPIAQKRRKDRATVAKAARAQAAQFRSGAQHWPHGEPHKVRER